MPLISAAKLNGIISRLGDTFVLRETRRTTGMKMATTAVELMMEPSVATAAINSTMSFVSSPRGGGIEPVSDPARDAGPHEPLADHEQRRDQNDRGIGKPGQGLVHRDDARQRHRNHHEKRHRIHAGAADHEHCDRCRKHDEDQCELHLRTLGGCRAEKLSRLVRLYLSL